jgi:hypothetical protein
MKPFLTPPAIAEMLEIKPSKVIAWIKSGELTASNVAAKRTGRPRWRISRASFDAFLLSRGPAPPPAPEKRRRRAATPKVIEFF